MMRASGATPVRLLLGSFAALILAGTLALMLPFATPAEYPIGWLDALFTATSAACVTGLVVRDTATGFTGFGQGVILLLIQLGGLGVMTLWLLVFWLLRGRVSLAFRSIFEHTLLAAAGERFWPLLRLVFLFTLLCEGAGALALFARWLPELGLASAAYHAVFHSISAFCNAGFALWPNSLVRFADDGWVNGVVMTLVVLGGAGFFVVFDVALHLRERRPLTVHSKLVLVVSALLIAGGAVAFWMLERGHALAGMSPADQALASLFQSVTARTAGFNTVDIGGLLPGTLFLLAMLMFVGGSPGSTAGGIKTTTLGILALTAWYRLRGGRQINVFRRTLNTQTVMGAIAVAGGGVVVSVAGLFLLLITEHAAAAPLAHEPRIFLSHFFETISALGTVGLSTGITPRLAPAAELVVTALMFLGRLGPLTVAAAVAVDHSLTDWEYPEEGVMVG